MVCHQGPSLYVVGRWHESPWSEAPYFFCLGDWAGLVAAPALKEQCSYAPLERNGGTGTCQVRSKSSSETLRAACASRSLFRQQRRQAVPPYNKC